jgi:enamine deaminase RidA (YjgF/YER057c/UK114 family)
MNTNSVTFPQVKKSRKQLQKQTNKIMEQILELLETASKQIADAGSTMKKINTQESVLHSELSRINELSNEYKLTFQDLQRKRINLITKLSRAVIETVGERKYMVRKDGIYYVSILSIPPNVVMSYRLGSDPYNRTHMEDPEFFAGNLYEKAYHYLCFSMIQTLKNYLRHSPLAISERSKVLGELFEEFSCLSKT